MTMFEVHVCSINVIGWYLHDEGLGSFTLTVRQILLSRQRCLGEFAVWHFNQVHKFAFVICLAIKIP